MAGTFTATSKPTQPGSYTDFIDELVTSISVSQAQTVSISGTHSWGPYNEPTLVDSYEAFVAIFGSTDDDLRRAVYQCFLGEGVGGKGGAGAVLVTRMGRAGTVASATTSLNSSQPFTATTTNASDTITAVSSFVGLAVGQAVTGTGIPGSTTITELKSGTNEIKLSNKATANGAGVTLTAVGAALTVTAFYPGTFGNNISLTTQAGTVSNTQQLLVLVNGAVAERFTFATNTSGFIATLAEEVNAVSRYVKATETNDNAPLAVVAGKALTAGNDGTAITSADYTTTFASLANEGFGVVAFANLTDPTITSAVQAWAESENHSGKRFELVLGGLIGESVATAEAAALGLNNENIVRIGVGTITDTENLVPGVPTNISTAQFAPRVAGVIANRGEKKDLVMARFSGVQLNSDAAQSAEIASAPNVGLTVLSSDGRQDAPVRIAQGCTTFTRPTNAADPRNPARFAKGKNVYGVVKYVRIMQGIETDILDWQEETDGNLGDLNVNERTATTLVGFARSEVIGKRITAGVIQGSSTAFLDENTFGPFSEDNDFVAIMYGVQFSPSLRQVFNSIQVNI